MQDPTSSLVRRVPALSFAWLGGAAFVASLFYFLYFYFVQLGHDRPSAGPVGRAVAIDVALFAAFALHHSTMARSRAKDWLARLAPVEHERTLYVWVASALFFAVCWGWQRIPGQVYRVDGWASALFHALQVGGILLAVVSARSIDVLDLSGIRRVRQPGASPVAAHEMGRLETGGPYRLVRHPIYLGTLVLLVATPALTADRLLFSGLVFVYLAIGIALEERSLRATFGAAYADYARRVRWRLVPGVY